MRRIVAVVGPTAVGKSDLAIALAVELGGEIVNADAMQVYRGMDIGTAKVPPDERRGVPHHLLDILDVTEPATVAEFQTMARAAIDDCLARDVVPILAGGSALYTRAILDDFEFPGTNPAIRERLETELAEVGAVALHQRLAELDLAAAEQIHIGNSRRIVRALEVIELTGRPFKATLPTPSYVYDGVVQVGLEIDRPLLDERIATRVRAMWDAGFVEEVRRLEAVGLREGRTANRALGYRQLLRFLAGESDEATAFDETVAKTRRFARRQLTWYRSDARIGWLPHDAPDLLERACAAVRLHA